MAKQMGTPVQYHNTVVQVLHVHVHKNISEPQVPSPRKASRPRCQPVTQWAGCVLANT